MEVKISSDVLGYDSARNRQTILNCKTVECSFRERDYTDIGTSSSEKLWCGAVWCGVDMCILIAQQPINISHSALFNLFTIFFISIDINRLLFTASSRHVNVSFSDLLLDTSHSIRSSGLGLGIMGGAAMAVGGAVTGTHG